MNGFGTLVRLALRRDRILLPVWIAGLTFMVVFSATATKDLYPDPADLATAAETINATASLVALYGKVYDPTSLGAVSLIKMTAFGAALVSILFVFITVRHSRSEEESGRLELVQAGAVGRAAPLAAAVAVGMGASAVLGTGVALGLGLVGLPAPGAVAFGLGWASSGIVFTAIAAVAAQVTTSARAAIGLGVAMVGVAYALRALGDLAQGDPGLLSWLSPIGWSQQFRPFAGDRWWVVVLPLLAVGVLVSVAFALRSRRDLGAGLVPDRPGPAVGTIRTVTGLAWRLQRGLLLAWLAGAALMGLALGSIASNVQGLLDSEQMRGYLEVLGGEQAITDAFLAAEIALMGAIVAAYGVAATSRLGHEETSGHAELLLSTATTRVAWAASHVGLALAGVAAVMLVAGGSVGFAHGLTVNDPLGQSMRMTGAALAQVPAAWVVVAAVMVLFGWLPRWLSAAWGLLVALVVLGEFGALWQLPTWVLELSPFGHSPRLPGGDVAVGSLAGLVVVAAALAAVGFVGWRRRDVRT